MKVTESSAFSWLHTRVFGDPCANPIAPDGTHSERIKMLTKLIRPHTKPFSSIGVTVERRFYCMCPASQGAYAPSSPLLAARNEYAAGVNAAAGSMLGALNASSVFGPSVHQQIVVSSYNIFALCDIGGSQG